MSRYHIQLTTMKTSEVRVTLLLPPSAISAPYINPDETISPLEKILSVYASVRNNQREKRRGLA